ncbi:hypothetical protein Pse7367_3108 [Thalassoporum mexicanum PCC 7367]|uniref:hypothetical protein n=1 Tax=Thalassoporum mexicanum TaxID=3457544 RepID=UPI00029FFA80|nr:hypothetical protein [Pseudanabaena sp. PCC 7367]AFY71357.1 hypothetical protein Pse7367_3108 [Pseudanabaena sp. PCC 7367]
MANLFETNFPNIVIWVESYGYIEIGDIEDSDSYVRAMKEGDPIWEGGNSYASLDEALQDLEEGITEWLEEHGEL